VRLKDTEPGVGTTIEFILPIQYIPGRSVTGEPDPESRKLSLLWVDDDEVVGDLAIRFIERLGHEGMVVDDGKSALQAISEHSFDLVITDLGMAGMSGFDLSDEIHRIARTYLLSH
jgi:PleD family two-component response regulator